MSTQPEASHQGQPDHQITNVYADLVQELPDHQKTDPTPTDIDTESSVDLKPDRSEEYNDTVQGMKSQLAFRINKLGPEAGMNAVWDMYVDGAEDDDSAMFASVMLRAKWDRDNQAWLDVNRNSQDREGIYAVKSSLAEQNNLVRTLVHDQRGAFSIGQLAEWYGDMAGSALTAKWQILGAIGEIGILESLQERNELQRLRFGTLDEDLRGGDIIGYDPKVRQRVAIDAKSGYVAPIAKLTQDGIQMVVGIPDTGRDSIGDPLYDKFGVYSPVAKKQIGELVEIGLQRIRNQIKHSDRRTG